MIRIAIRADASVQIGSGHVMRSLALANELRDHGAEVMFICREHPGHLFSLIEASQHQLLKLPAVTVGLQHAQQGHNSWLGISQDDDAKQTREMLRGKKPLDWLVVDHYGLDKAWETAMRTVAKHIIVIDDLAGRRHDCDVLLDQNYYKNMGSRHAEYVPAHCRKLLGPKYALLRPEFREICKTLKTRDGSVKRILIFFGGSDPTNETGKVLRAIKSLELNNIETNVVVGAANPHFERIANFCAELPGTRLHRQVNNMAELMAGADLAIGAGGGAMWERCCLGLPAIVTSIADNQIIGCEAMATSGQIVYLGKAQNVSDGLLAAAIQLSIASPWLLSHMGQAGMKLVDGKGCQRIARLMIPPEVSLRQAISGDCQAVFRWRNAEETRRFSGNSEVIPYERHVEWFENALLNPDQLMLVAKLDEVGVGVIRFDRVGHIAVVSLYLAPECHGRGLGFQLLDLGIEQAKENWPTIEFIEATIMNGNNASISIFSEAGFTLQSSTFTKRIKD